MVIVCLILAAVPFVCYLAVKLGTVAFYRGRQLFHDSVENERKRHGD